MASCVSFGSQQYFGFDPRTIPGCGLWLDAADTRTLTTSAGGNVTQWADKSGAGANMTPLGTNSNATIQTNYTNGLSAVNFAGLNQYQTPADKGVYPSDVYILVALKSLVRMDIISIGPTSTDNFNSLTFGEYTALRWHNGSSGFARTPQTVSPTNETSTSLLLMNWSIANNNFVIRRNGTQLSSTASYTYTPTAGAIIQIGFRHQNFGTNLAINAYVAEVVTYNRQLDLAERQQVEGYLAWKWALNSSLATSHPYRYVPPIMRNFQPVDITGGTLLWLDAADATTITGSPVTQWTDKSGRGSNAVTGLGSVVAGDAINSWNTLRFGYNMTLNLSNFVMPSSQTSIFYVFRGATTNPNASAGTGYFVFSRTADNFLSYSGNQQFFCYQNPAASRSYVGVMGSTSERNWGNLSTTAFFNAVNVISTTGNSYASSNGLSLPLVGTGTAANTVFTATTYQIGTSRNIGDVYSFDLGELIVCDGTLSTAAAQQMEGYLAWKWGVPRSLPTTHPYYNALPSTALLIPTTITGCILWLDASDPSVFTGGGATWTDKSGTANNATNGTPPTTAMPAATTWSNGLTAARFVVANQNSIKTTNTIPAFNVTYFVVVRITALVTPAAQQFLFINNIDGQRQLETDATAFPARVRFTTRSASGYPTITNVTQDQQFMLSITVPTSAGSSLAYANGSIASVATSPVLGTTGNSIHYFGSANGASGYISADIAEILIYNTVLSTTNRQRVEGYLAWKWGLQNSLPSAHPYSKFRP